MGVGTELLLGQIANTNAQTISSALASIGVDVYRHTVVGDNRARIATAVGEALARADVVILTGGLGPTPDDITSEAVGEALGLALHRDERLVALIRDAFASLGRDMPESNLKQADLPEGATPIDPEGTAPGWFVERGSSLVFALPGVPWEMESMLTKAVVPLLRARGGGAATVSREVLVIGLGESHTHRQLADLVATQDNPTLAYLAGRGQVRVRITAKAAGEAEARALIAPVEEEIRARLGNHAVEGEEGSLAARFAALVRAQGLTVGAAESLTGGLLGAEITGAPGASDFFAGSLVCYSNDAKVAVAGVDPTLLERHGAVSEECARALAEGAARALGADLALATTGVAGPDELEGRPVGTIYVAATRDGRTEARALRGYGNRANVRAMAVTWALDLGRRLLDQ